VNRIRRIDRRNLLERLTIPHVDLSCQVTESSDTKKSSLGVVGEEVTRVGAEIVDNLDSSIEDNSLRRHVCMNRII